MSILVTGGTGFVGAELARQLLAQGERDLVVTHRSGNFRRVADIAEALTFLQMDLADREGVTAAVAQVRPRVIYHLAAMLTAPSEGNPPAAIETNALGTYYLLEAARQFGVEQVLFASSIGTYGANIREPVIDDYTVQRPFTVYGVTKIFGEGLGLFYKRRYGVDFRGIRYPSVIGPGADTPGPLQYTSWMIEAAAQGQPFTAAVAPHIAAPIIYNKEAAQAMIQLGRAPLAQIQMGNYLVNGHQPTPTAAELADAVRAQIPGAQITFEPDPQSQPLIERFVRPVDDHVAREEWGWQPQFTLDEIVTDFVAELREHPERHL